MALIRNTKRREKILDNGFQSNCGTHAKVWTNPSYIEKRAEIRHRSVMLPALQLYICLLLCLACEMEQLLQPRISNQRVVLLRYCILMEANLSNSYVQAGATAIKLILRNFAPVIKSNMAAPPVSVGVDLVREER